MVESDSILCVRRGYLILSDIAWGYLFDFSIWSLSILSGDGEYFAYAEVIEGESNWWRDVERYKIYEMSMYALEILSSHVRDGMLVAGDSRIVTISSTANWR